MQDAGYSDEADACFSRALELTRAAPNPLGRVLVDHLESNAFEHPALSELRRMSFENSSYEDSVKEGNLAFNQGDFARAAAHFSNAAALKPGYADLHCKLGMSFLEMTEEAKAADSFRRAIELNPGYVEAHYCLGAALYRLKAYDQAKVYLEKAASLRPDYADIHCHLGIVLLGLGRVR